MSFYNFPEQYLDPLQALTWFYHAPPDDTVSFFDARVQVGTKFDVVTCRQHMADYAYVQRDRKIALQGPMDPIARMISEDDVGERLRSGRYEIFEIAPANPRVCKFCRLESMREHRR